MEYLFDNIRLWNNRAYEMWIKELPWNDLGIRCSDGVRYAELLLYTLSKQRARYA